MGTFRRLGFTFIVAIFTLLATSAVFAQDENAPAPRRRQCSTVTRRKRSAGTCRTARLHERRSLHPARWRQ